MSEGLAAWGRHPGGSSADGVCWAQLVSTGHGGAQKDVGCLLMRPIEGICLWHVSALICL